MAIRRRAASLIFNYYAIVRRDSVCFKVKSIIETVDEIIKNRKSVIRFGDGEIIIIRGKNIGFQKSDEKLRNSLIEIASSKSDNLLLCIPDVFNSLLAYTPPAKLFWESHLLSHRNVWLKYFSINNIYGNAFISRPYMDYKDKVSSKIYFDKIKSIWFERDVILIEGRYTKNGINNDLLNGAKSVNRIICPEKNAFSCVDEVVNEAIKKNNNNLFLVSLGPAAKSIVFELQKKDYWAIDIGHLDVEYEWYMAKTPTKIAIKGKQVNEVGVYINTTDNYLLKFNSQIIYTVKSIDKNLN